MTIAEATAHAVTYHDVKALGTAVASAERDAWSDLAADFSSVTGDLDEALMDLEIGLELPADDLPTWDDSFLGDFIECENPY